MIGIKRFALLALTLAASSLCGIATAALPASLKSPRQAATPPYLNYGVLDSSVLYGWIAGSPEQSLLLVQSPSGRPLYIALVL